MCCGDSGIRTRVDESMGAHGTFASLGNKDNFNDGPSYGQLNEAETMNAWLT